MGEGAKRTRVILRTFKNSSLAPDQGGAQLATSLWVLDEPFETFVDGIKRGLRVPFDVRIVNAENYDTTLVAGMKPIEDECSSAPDMKVSSGRGRKADACHNSEY